MLKSFSTRYLFSVLTTSVFLAGAFNTATFAMDKEEFPNNASLRVLNHAYFLPHGEKEMLIIKNFRQVCKFWQQDIDAKMKQNIRDLMENKTVLFRLASDAFFSSFSWEIKDSRFPSDQAKQGAIDSIMTKIDTESTLFLKRIYFSARFDGTDIMTFTCKLLTPIGPKDPDNVLAEIAVKVIPAKVIPAKGM